MKKILIWVDTFPQYSETFIRDHICGLIDRHYDVTIFARKKETDNLAALVGFEGYELMQKTITLKDIVPQRKGRRILAALMLLIQSVAKGHTAALLRSLNLFEFGKQALTLNPMFLCHYLMSEGIGIVHAHYGPNGSEATVMKRILPGIKLVTTFHGYDIRKGLQEGGRIYSRLFDMADNLIAISEYNHRSLVELGAPESKIVRIANGVFLNHLLAIERPASHFGKSIRILSVGRLVKEKSYALILKALQRLKESYPDIRFEYSVIGEGELRSEIEQLVLQLGLSEDVVLHGKKSSLDVCRLMAQSDVYLLGSIAEALPTVLIEAQAAAMPVIATNVGSVTDMIEDRKAGIIVEANDADELVRGIEYMLTHREHWNEMGCRGRQFAQNTYSIEHSIAKLDAVYSDSTLA